MQACASRITAPSMQPPDTEPCISPASSTISMLPAGRGEEPQVETTVATAALRPASRHAASCSRRRSSVCTMLVTPFARRRDPLAQPLGPARALAAQHRGQLAQAAQAVGRAEIVDVADHRPGPRRDGRVGVEPQQRVEPDQPPAALVQPLHLDRQPVAGVAVQPVADQQHHRTLAQHPARPDPVELLQAGADPRPAGPVLDQRRRSAPAPGRCRGCAAGG